MLGDIPKELIDKINENAPTHQVKWWRRMVIIIVANCCGTLIAGGVLGFFTIIWTKSNATDTNYNTINRHEEINTERYSTLLNELATLRAEFNKTEELLDLMLADKPEPQNPYAVPPYIPTVTQTQSNPDITQQKPSVIEVQEAQEQIQQRIDKAIYRRDQLKK